VEERQAPGKSSVRASCASKIKGNARKTSENYAIDFYRGRKQHQSRVFGSEKILRGERALQEKRNQADLASGKYGF
jgi:hypothetical protein